MRVAAKASASWWSASAVVAGAAGAVMGEGAEEKTDEALDRGIAVRELSSPVVVRN